MLSSLKLKLLDPTVCDWYMLLDADRSRRLPHGGHGGGCMAARGDENSIMDIVIDMGSEGCSWLRCLQVVVKVTDGRMMIYVT
jgi:hypothetical protein